MFKLLRNAFLKSFLFNEQKKVGKKSSESVFKQPEVFSLNKIKNIDDPTTDDDNYEEENYHDEDDDTIATTVTTYTNITSVQNNNHNEEEDYLLIGSWLYEQIKSNGTALPETNVEPTKANINETNLSNSTQILDTTFDLDTGNQPDQGVINIFYFKEGLYI